MSNAVPKIRVMPPPFSLGSALWFLDTNCLSYLLQCSSVEKLNDVTIVITASTLGELRRRPELLEKLEDLSTKLKVVYFPTVLNIFKAEIYALLETKPPLPEFVDLQPISTTLLKELRENKDFLDQAESENEKFIETFLKGAEEDLGAQEDERDLGLRIQTAGNMFSKEWFGKPISPYPVTPDNFPGLYTHFYCYYFRYIKQPNAKPEKNDLTDLSFTTLAPYSQRYYGEKKFSHILKNEVQGIVPPSIWKIYKKNWSKTKDMTQEDFDLMKSRRDMFDFEYRLLEGLEIGDYNDFIQMLS